MDAGITLLTLAFVGTAAVSGAAFMLGFDKSGPNFDVATATRYLRDYAPDMKPQHVALGHDGKTALIACDQGCIFLVTVLGDRPVVRQLSAQDIGTIENQRIRIDVNDIGFPPRDFSAPQETLQLVLDVLNQGQSK
jgi:hypothetical protein